jgi:hypothetical protein
MRKRFGLASCEEQLETATVSFHSVMSTIV